MKLHYYKPSDGSSNFGDELNKDLWEHYFPNFFDDDTSQVFFGIGTILQAAKKFYPTSEIIVFGSGAPNARQQKDANFTIKFVRGPLSAKALGAESTPFITDPAILTPNFYPVTHLEKKYAFAYMPHYSVANESYRKAVERSGIKYIDPRSPVFSIIDDINATETLICEAMHGAIIADAYRVPWIPVYSYESFNHFKWKDWGGSLGLSFDVHRLPRLYQGDGLKVWLKQWLFSSKLKKIKKATPFLSDLEISQEAKEKVLKQITQFKAEYGAN